MPNAPAGSAVPVDVKLLLLELVTDDIAVKYTHRDSTRHVFAVCCGKVTFADVDALQPVPDV